MKPNYLDDLEHSAPPVVGYPWVPHHGGQSYSSGYPSTSWYLPPQGYQEYYHSASPSAPPLPQPVQRPAHQFRQNYRRRFSLRSFMETCLEALCCCWIVELCLPWQISVMESCFNLQRIKPGTTDLVCLFQRSKRVISGYMRDGIWPGFSIKHFFSPIWFSNPNMYLDRTKYTDSFIHSYMIYIFWESCKMIAGLWI